ncbi:MAG: hypothetical protein IE909_09785 [Campylobacterales bacterium]|nr:hypothetical protein [Campylobacterales bacterium]
MDSIALSVFTLLFCTGEKYMSVRTIPKNYRNVTGIHASVKSEEKAMFESTLERDFITLLEFDNDVVSFDVQPVKIKWFDQNGKSRSYFPDVLVKKKLLDALGGCWLIGQIICI